MDSTERAETLAALDLGTTNCRLLIAKPVGYGALRIIDSFSRIVRLGEGLDASGVLSEAAMARSIDALMVCASKLTLRQVTRARFVATEACRRASNGDEFLSRVYQATGFDLEIIPTGEEARLALAGCLPLIDPHCRHALVFDIGGGSTEVLWVVVRPRHDGRAATEIRGILSVPHGVVSLTERFQDEPGGPETFERMVALICGRFEKFDAGFHIRDQIAQGEVQMLGSSGTVTTLAAMNLGLPRYDRAKVDGVWLDFDVIKDTSSFLVNTDTAGRSRQPCIGVGRADLMVAGCAILAAICETWPVGKLRVADRGVREGILSGLMSELRANRYRSRNAAAQEGVAASSKP